ncbi:CDP-diacylglycerol--glycerol-3-phosphate 3-phosphatidyltransferase [Histidinibacterium aquaticum]|uniref:CDP-diacylglycerol--glycerol-3-phosphate 3-phosphatidyltransferase n=1 Tax=Histidinibacterium aquaticum TaxID=2613962 RepID=A0A5J5GB11_9RHOB|nr:CDP-diacylglycerol--glycerol-3-phosphate 3-phosphatidyltransferase [Histidinibacterium aquaticum]KAA9005299.1 CDP-diacylglycerol--glycerol-3-phosphate 3-phosphatidyltransferase [Histidinibacterium aquaticum]
MRWTLPNILTILRLLAAPGVALVFLYFNRPFADWVALIVFASVAATDWIDGRLARAWGLETRFGAAMDPIADKAMVLIALAVILGYTDMSPWLVLPAVLIIFREVFVSGLREYIGPGKTTLKVTWLAKWKTTAQMLAIAVLFSQGIFTHHEAAQMADAAGWAGIVLLWIAAILTLITGYDYFQKSMPFLKEPE